jgi:putative DNA primase/helicase
MRVPGELTQYKQWVLWRRAKVNGRKLKLPISPWSGKAASSDKPETWASFRHACFALRKYKADGIGFVFTTEDPFCGIGLDKCRSRRGSIDAHCLELVRKLHSYTELSPSGEVCT